LPVKIEKSSQQVVETDQVIDMTVGHKDRMELQEFPRAKSMQFTTVKQQRLPSMRDAYIESRISKGSVDQMWIEDRSHISIVPDTAKVESCIQKAF
jgi:hypothetical protein